MLEIKSDVLQHIVDIGDAGGSELNHALHDTLVEKTVRQSRLQKQERQLMMRNAINAGLSDKGYIYSSTKTWIRR